MADNRPSRYTEPDPQNPGQELVVYRASGLGGCVRSMVAAARGYKPRDHQDWFQEVLDEGTRMEGAILDAYMAKSRRAMVDLQPEVTLEIGNIDGRRVIVRGHMDGIGRNPGQFDERLVEAKKFRDSTWSTAVSKGVDVNAYYPWQLSVYMHATLLPADFVIGHYDQEKDSITEVKVFPIEVPPVPLHVIKQRVAKVERLVNQGFGPDEVECSGGYPCPFYYLHDGFEDKKVVEDVALPQTEQVAALITKWRELAAWIKDEEAIVKNLQESKKLLAEELRGVIGGMEGLAPGTLKFTAAVGEKEFAVTWTKTSVPERTTKAYDLDYFTVKERRTKK